MPSLRWNERRSLAVGGMAFLAISTLHASPARASGGGVSLDDFLWTVGLPYVLYIVSALASVVLSPSFAAQPGARALFWTQACIVLVGGSLLMGLASDLFGPLGLIYAPGQLGVLVISSIKAPRSKSRYLPLVLPSTAILPGIILAAWLD